MNTNKVVASVSVLAGITLVQPVLAESCSIAVKGATFTVRTSGRATDTVIPQWVHSQLGPVTWSSQLSRGLYGVFKKVEVDCKISHCKAGNTFQLYQGFKGTVSPLIDITNGKANPNTWTCDAIGTPGSQPAGIGVVPPDWSQYSSGTINGIYYTGAKVTTIAQKPWQQYSEANRTGTIYLWDNPGIPTDSSGHPSVRQAGDCSINFSFEDVVKYNVDGHSRYPVNHYYATWSHTLTASAQLQPPTTNVYYLNVTANR